MPQNKSVITRPVTTQFEVKDGEIRPYWDSVLSPTECTIRAECVVPPKDVIMVVFVPGIMGSNIKTAKGKNAWQPPNGKINGSKEWWHRKGQTPSDRQAQLNPDTTVVDDNGAVALPSDGYPYLDAKEARRRGWGTMHWDSYGPILTELERRLNCSGRATPDGKTRPAGYWQSVMNPTQKQIESWNAKSGLEGLTLEELTKLGRYYLPVHAVGYNWLQSNEQSAEHLKNKIAEFKKLYSKPKGYFRYKGCILVSHSMGGLVTRALVKLKGMEDEILGVVHGVQPVTGAPAVYRRFRAGTEAAEWYNLPEAMGATVLGWDAADATAVLANAPGPLELLPTKHYPPGWLHLYCESPQGPTQVTLPLANPYKEIYRKSTDECWWGMVNPKLIDPAGIHKRANVEPSDAFNDRLSTAEKFHDRLALQFHRITYAYYGSDPAHQSFGQVRWMGKRHKGRFTDEEIKTAKWAEMDYLGDTKVDGEKLDGVKEKTAGFMRGIEVFPPALDTQAVHRERIRFVLSDRDIAGDGTVPHPSGAAVETCGLKQTFRMTGFDHQHSYSDPYSQQVTLYSIAKIVQQAKDA